MRIVMLNCNVRFPPALPYADRGAFRRSVRDAARKVNSIDGVQPHRGRGAWSAGRIADDQPGAPRGYHEGRFRLAQTVAQAANR